MAKVIRIESPLTPEAQKLIARSQQSLLAVFPPDEIFSFSPEELATPDVVFLVARDGGQAAGCVALVDCGGYGEVKRLFVPVALRGRGLGRALMTALESRARAAGMASIRLETGVKLDTAVALYAAMGFQTCGPFGDYTAHPASLFMEKHL